MFRLLFGELQAPSTNKKEIAKQLLAEDIDLLEVTTKRIRQLCQHDLQGIAATGILQPGSLLHGILMMVSRDLRLDAGELESLNSMIKST